MISRVRSFIVFLALFTFLALIGLDYQDSGVYQRLSTVQTQLQAAVYGIASITSADMRGQYRQASLAIRPTAHISKVSTRDTNKVRVLIVPGHELDSGGTAFNGVNERDVAVDIADALAALLKTNPRYEVIVARSKDAWNPILENYFTTDATDIATFREQQMTLTNALISKGSLAIEPNQVDHNAATLPAALHLYGINKWASENNVALTIHIHLNDYRRRGSGAGAYSGFAIYVPDHQYSNATASKEVGDTVMKRLAAYHSPSTLPGESAGVIEDQQLIAIGSNNSADDASILIEYAYMYEPQIMTPSVRPLAVTDYAYATYLGLQDFFNDPVSGTDGSAALSYDWSKVTAQSGDAGAGIYALQTALHHLGYYPSAGKTLADCPISGTVGPCTQAALKGYQAAHTIESTGVFGPLTRHALEQDLQQKGPFTATS